MQFKYVITSTELGWDCVIGVFETRDLAREYVKENLWDDGIDDTNCPYVVHETQYYTSVTRED